MCSELFRIPYSLGPIPLFGFGVLLLVWLIVSAVAMVRSIRTYGWGAETWGNLPVLVLVAGAIIWLPRLFPTGLPVRGYGLMLLLAGIASVTLASIRAEQIGIHRDTIISITFWIFLGGILGARFFYVVEYWETDFQGMSAPKTIAKIINFPQGGLVIYGGLIGGAVAFFWYLRKHGLPLLAMADIAAPAFMVGLAIGRIGCLLNGCCYGGPSDLPWAVTFPAGSPPYNEQIARGLRTGVQFEMDEQDRPQVVLSEPQAAIPERSLPVHPTQIYSTINAGLITWLLWTYFPFRRRDGEVAAVMLTIYPATRYLLEIIRTDETNFFGTGMSISQNISVVILIAMLIGWFHLRSLPPKLATLIE